MRFSGTTYGLPRRCLTGNSLPRAIPRRTFPVDRDEIDKRLHVAQQIVKRVLPGEDWSPWFGYGSPERLRWLALKAISQLEREEELRINLGDEAPPVMSEELHPWVWEGAPQYWRIGAYNAAIWQALIRLNVELQRKIGRREVSEADAFAQAFTLDAPQAGRSRLRLMEDDGSKTYQNVHKGAILLAQALYAGVRNPLDHDAVEDPPEQEALETMAAISLLARWTDRACVVEVGDE